MFKGNAMTFIRYAILLIFLSSFGCSYKQSRQPANELAASSTQTASPNINGCETIADFTKVSAGTECYFRNQNGEITAHWKRVRKKVVVFGEDRTPTEKLVSGAQDMLDGGQIWLDDTKVGTQYVADNFCIGLGGRLPDNFDYPTANYRGLRKIFKDMSGKFWTAVTPSAYGVIDNSQAVIDDGGFDENKTEPKYRVLSARCILR
jgi:hypothetical protein